ncbi:hypothetical protein D9611_004757 [Ephemerocybe angulata]|uniref:Uncharacterized protein n=1 Tax=Ephemerocybe angulata TaxID=980116 RepID=A0A8H5B3C9_9AGAR|nr:hypothetical protein D9611_004757 [Tulosesus angulatus]
MPNRPSLPLPMKNSDIPSLTLSGESSKLASMFSPPAPPTKQPSGQDKALAVLDGGGQLEAIPEAS